MRPQNSKQLDELVKNDFDAIKTTLIAETQRLSSELKLASGVCRLDLNQQSNFLIVLYWKQNNCAIRFEYFGPNNTGTDPGIMLLFNDKYLKLKPTVLGDSLLWRDVAPSSQFATPQELAKQITYWIRDNEFIKSLPRYTDKDL